MTARRGLILLALFIAASCCACGCGRRIFYEWRDEPYLRPVLAQGEAAARRRMGSVFADDRDIGCRVLSVIAREARRSGDETRARELAGELMEHYAGEPNPNVRSMLLAVCLRNAGRGDGRVADFLKVRLTRGEATASAAYALAALRAPGSFEAIAEALWEAGYCALEYELLGALWLLGDGRAIPLYEEALAEIDAEPSSWPERIHSQRRDVYRKAMRSRLETLRAAAGARGRYEERSTSGIPVAAAAPEQRRQGDSRAAGSTRTGKVHRSSGRCSTETLSRKNQCTPSRQSP